ncbi:hypothetical protein LCGC14_1585660 [marine sediment metagenome]|uniref:HTH cro/C1-type domain-containing protein n=1 Tax=marine sediment metagenome TaxID=412755 RepID=A0A0F9KW53_9ZZZZ
MTDFPDRLEIAMRRAGLSQAALATILGVSSSTISDWVSARYYPRAEILMVLPDVLAVSGHWLLTGRGQLAVDCR